MKDMKCEWCGKEYDEYEEEEIFSFEIFDYEYSRLTKELCAQCAIQGIEEEVEGVITVACYECGKDMDYFEEMSNYSTYGNLDCGLDGFSRRLCCDCAISLEDEEFPSPDDLLDE
jgi:hypothetical protein